MQLGSRGGHNKAEMEKLTDMLRAEGPVVVPSAATHQTAGGKADIAPPVMAVQKWVNFI